MTIESKIDIELVKVMDLIRDAYLTNPRGLYTISKHNGMTYTVYSYYKQIDDNVLKLLDIGNIMELVNTYDKATEQVILYVEYNGVNEVNYVEYKIIQC